MGQLRVACLQLNPGENLDVNLVRARESVISAARAGATLVVLPEMFAFMGPDEGRLNTASPFGKGVFAHLSAMAKESGVVLVGGSHGELPGDEGATRVFNTSCVFDRSGECLAVYRKRHLFHLWSAEGEALFSESETFLAGDRIVGFQISEGGYDWRVNLSICYDLRFPEAFRDSQSRAAPWDVIVLPAAFTHQTGQAHWEVLLRARAIENQCYVVACNQTGSFLGGKKRNYGHSLVVDPWGEIVASLGEEEGILEYTLNSGRITQSRQRLGALRDRLVPD